jgi:Tfp pilus assembly ATPase PilU
MQTSTSRGMLTMEQSLADLVQRRVITAEIAFARSSRPDQLSGILERAGFSDVSALFSGVDPLNAATAPLADTGLRLAGEG